MNRFNMTIDISVIMQNIKRNLAKILLLAVIIGCLAAVGLDYLMPPTYSCNIAFSVWGTESNYNSYAVRLMLPGINRYASMMTSDPMATEMCRYMGVDALPGTITTNSTYGVNVLNVTITSTKADDTLRMANALRKVYKNLTDQINSSYSIHPAGISNADYITVTKGQFLLYAILGALVVAFGGFFIIILTTIFDGKVQNLKQASEDIDTQLLGNIVHEKKKRNMLITNNMVSLPYTESFNTLAGTVQDALREKQLKTVMITSALENEGKSTVSANLALALARLGMRVVLVEADLRKPALHKLFEQKNPGSIADYLINGQAEGNIRAQQVADNLICCFAGKSCENPDVLLESTRMRKLLKFFSNSADVVLLDTSPACMTRDAQVLAEYVDASILVARFESAPVSQINTAVETLNAGKAELLGFVYNDNQVVVKQTNNGKSYYYNKNYAKNYSRG